MFTSVEESYFEPLESAFAELEPGNLDQPRYFVIDTHAPYLSLTPATAIAQHNANVALRTSRPQRPRTHVCDIAPCNGVTFGRGPELRRHHASVHDVRNARFWCPIDRCNRSRMEGGRAFPRKDKMMDHLMRVHGDRVGSAA